MASMDDIRDLPKGIELSDEMLEGVSGGELNQLQMMILDGRIKAYKEQGKSLDDLIAWVEECGKGHYEVNANGIWKWNNGYPQELKDEITGYLRQNW